MSVTKSEHSSNSTEKAAKSRVERSLEVEVRSLAEFVSGSVRLGRSAHEVEKGIWERILALGRVALGQFFDQMGDGDLGSQVSLRDGESVSRLPESHSRSYLSIFGEFEISRAVYGSREGQKIEFVPLDQRLELPESKFSYVLQDWDQHLVVDNPYALVNRTICRILGFSQSVDSLERMSRTMAAPVVDFLDTLSAPASSEEGELMVLSADGKGVPIRRGVGVAPTGGSPPSKGPKPGAKKMALVGASYSVDRHQRTPEDVVESLFRAPGDPSPAGSRPSPQHKLVRASLDRCEKGSTQPAVAEIFGWLASQAEERNPTGKKPLLILMDGQTSLWDAAADYFQEDTVEILDLLHVTPRLWRAAYLFHPQEGPAASQFVRERLLRILRGESRGVVMGLRRMGTVSGLTGRKRKQLERICHYLEKNAHRMQYGHYLAVGYPIATGVVEGACRHLVKDRMERSGMQWVLEGAQAVLDIRSIDLSSKWDEYQKYRIEMGSSRFPSSTQGILDNVKWPVAA